MTALQFAGNCCVTSLDDITDARPEMADRWGAMLLTATHGVVFALSLAANTLVLYVIGRHLGYRTATNVYITALCVADVFTALVGLPVAVGSVTLPRWSFGWQSACVAYDVVRRSLSLVSTSMTSELVLDRYMTVVKLHRVQTITRRTLITVAALVTFSVLASLPWYLIVVGSVCDGSEWSWPPLCLSQHVDVVVIYDVVYWAMSSGLPAVVLAGCAARVLRAVVRSRSAVRPSTSVAGQLLFHDELQTATTVVLLVVVFVTVRCVHGVLVGLAASTSLRSTGVARPQTRVLLDSAAALSVAVNGVVNPAVYAIRNPTVARVIRVGRPQRCGGYVADDATSASVAVTVATADQRAQDLGDGLSEDRSVVPRADTVCGGGKLVVSRRSSSVDFWMSLKTSLSPGVTSRRRSSQCSDRTTSTLTSVVL